jgi:hypothetical protein
MNDEAWDESSHATEESGDGRPNSTGLRSSKREVSTTAPSFAPSLANYTFSSWLALAGILPVIGVYAREYLARAAIALFARILIDELGVTFAALGEDISAFQCAFPCSVAPSHA